MKKVSGLFLVLTMLAATPAIAADALHKYDIKSGIVIMDCVQKLGAMEMKSKFVVYFDDYGMKECKETYEDGTLTEVDFSDGKARYGLYPAKKTALKKGAATRGTELRVEWTEMGTQEDRDSGKYKKIAPIVVAGKQCEAFEMNNGAGTITQYAGWKKIMVYMKLKSASMTSTTKATKIEENVAVPAAKFQIPAGYTIK